MNIYYVLNNIWKELIFLNLNIIFSSISKFESDKNYYYQLGKVFKYNNVESDLPP